MVFPRIELLAALLACCFVGCSNNVEPTSTGSDTKAAHDDHEGHDDHDHGDHEGQDHDTVKPGELGLSADDLPDAGGPPMPASFDEAVKQVVALVTTINKGLADSDVDSVHDELHDVGNALENAETLAKSSQQSPETMAAIDQLFDAFGAIDAKLHGEEGKEFADVKSDIEAAVKNLSSSVK